MIGSEGADFTAAIDGLYEAAAVPSLWPLALERYAHAVGAYGALAGYAPPNKSQWFVGSPWCVDSATAYVDEGWHSLKNPRISRAMKLHAAGQAVVSDAMLFKPGELDRQPIQREFFDRFGLRSFCGFQAIPGQVLISIEYGRDPVPEQGLELVRASVPHFTRLARLSLARGFSAEVGALSALDAVKTAALIVDHDGRMVRMNERALRLHASILKIDSGEMRSLAHKTAAAFERMVLKAASPHATVDPDLADFVVLRNETGRPIMAQAVPLKGVAPDLFQRAKAIVLLFDPAEDAHANAACLARIYGLTESEARIASGIGRGATIGDMSAMLGVSQSTVRTHLRSVFAKTGSHRQAELAALLGRIP